MQAAIEELRAKLQGLFDEFNTDGSWMSAMDADGKEIWRDLIDSYTVTRLAPHLDAEGNITKTDFWLMFRWVGYNNGFQYTHTIKVVNRSQDDTYLLDLTDDRGRRYHIELIMDVAEHDCVVAWNRWLRYKDENRELFEAIDAQLLEEHVRIAEGWDAT
jgi:hypothetical protein